jgi:excisionase family DNA binding protein
MAPDSVLASYATARAFKCQRMTDAKDPALSYYRPAIFEDDGIYTTADLAEIFRCSKAFIGAQFSYGSLRGFKMGRLWRVRGSEVKRWAAELEQKTRTRFDDITVTPIRAAADAELAARAAGLRYAMRLRMARERKRQKGE